MFASKRVGPPRLAVSVWIRLMITGFALSLPACIQGAFVLPPSQPTSHQSYRKGCHHHTQQQKKLSRWQQRRYIPQFFSMLGSEQEHAREVFSKFDADASGTISSVGFFDMLRMLDIDATEEDADALFKYLENSDGLIDIDDFMPWYEESVEQAKEVSSSFQSLLIGRRTVDHFDQTPVRDDVLRRAISCAIAAPNRSMSEPWRFIQVGPQTVVKFAELNRKMTGMGMETDGGAQQQLPIVDWKTIPGWCVVTNKLTPGDIEMELDDFKSTSCAIQNFMLSMWSEGIGTKWTSGPVQKTQEFADLCGVDTTKERVVGCIWYGFASGGLVSADPKRRKKDVDDVLSTLP